MKKLATFLAAAPLLLSVVSPVLAQTNNLAVGIAPSNYIQITSLPKLLSSIIGVILIVVVVLLLLGRI